MIGFGALLGWFGALWLWSNRIHRGDHIETIYSPSDSDHVRFAGILSSLTLGTYTTSRS